MFCIDLCGVLEVFKLGRKNGSRKLKKLISDFDCLLCVF